MVIDDNIGVVGGIIDAFVERSERLRKNHDLLLAALKAYVDRDTHSWRESRTVAEAVKDRKERRTIYDAVLGQARAAIAQAETP